MTETLQFRKKPVVIEAMQYGPYSAPSLALLQFIGQDVSTTADGIVIHTLEGDMLASVGDWIIRGVNGEFYPCKPDIFAKTYEAADERAPVTVSEAAWVIQKNGAEATAAAMLLIIAEQLETKGKAVLTTEGGDFGTQVVEYAAALRAEYAAALRALAGRHW